MLHPKDNLKSSQVCDLCRRARQHKGGRAPYAHPVKKPLLQKGDGSSAAGIKRHPDGGGHQYPKSFAASEK